jgi:hypothetical protein
MTRFGKAGALATLLLAGGCGSANRNEYLQYWQILKASANASFKSSRITFDQAAAIPYASMGWRMNGGDESLVVLATDDAQGQLWTSARHVVLQTRDGRLMRTVGMPRDLALNVASALPPPATALSAPYTIQLTADFPTAQTYGTKIRCVGRAMRAETITIIGKAITTRRIDESCTATDPLWSFVNQYWVDPQSGFVWRAVQHINPDGDVVELTILRPPG